MAYKDLREFIARLKEEGELREITAEVDPRLEITEITTRMIEEEGPALLFKRVKGSPYPVLINAFGSFRRMALAFGLDSIDEAVADLDRFINSEVPANILDKLKNLPKLKRLARVAPKIVSRGPCQEVVLQGNEVDLEKFPLIQCWPGDAGKYITLPAVFTKDPETGVRNCGMYRIQVFDRNTAAMHWHIHKHGAFHYRKQEGRNEPLEVAVVIGGDPLTIYSASTPLPEGIDELLLAGFFRRKPVELVKCKTIDLEVPATAEIVLEGLVYPDERRVEGPFGDHTGHYSNPEEYPVFHIQCLTHRKNPVYQTCVTGRPPMEDWYMGQTSVRVFSPLLKKTLPEIVDMNLPKEGVFHNLAIVSIRKQYPHQARKLMHSMWGLGQLIFTKMIVVVDDDVDVHNLSDVLFHLGNNIDPKWDVVITEGVADSLDLAARQKNFSSKIGFDATRKLPDEGYSWEWPKPISMSEKIIEQVTRRWREYGISDD
ncbi:MAG: menaquinone biosynthesis decarboxylase [bacterium]